MPIEFTWNEIALRLGLAFLAGALVGINRGEHARPAGLRTTILICLAAAVAMLQANRLMNTTGKTPDSFVVMDIMRLPLGILTGVGFIGAGAIIQRDNLVTGVTTAATIWFVTVMGLCFGGGQIGLGLTALALCLIVLWGLKPMEKLWKQDRRGVLSITIDTTGPNETAISQAVGQAGFKITSWSLEHATELQTREYQCTLLWRARLEEARVPAFFAPLARMPGVTKLAWRPS